MTLLAVFCFLGARAQTTVEIGNPQSTTTEHRFPVCMYYNHSLTQQIYTADEIGMAGTISSIAFEYTYSNSFSMEGVQMYMMNVDKESFESNTDIVALDDATKVWEGTFTASGACWVTIDLDTPFAYDGTSNLLLCCYYPNETNVNYPGSNFKFRTTATEAYLGIAYFHDSYVPSLEDVSTYSGTKYRYQYRNNIQLVITPSGVQVCSKPTLSVSNVTNDKATLTVGGGSYKYNVQYKLASAENWTDVAINSTETSFTLTGLTPLTAYEVRAQSICDGNATSDWRTARFTTTAVAEPVGDSWSDNFEGTTCGWELINGTLTNAWAWGTAANHGGTKGLYISNDDGTTNAYTTTSSTMVYATKLLQFADGRYEFSYDWLANGEGTWDFLRVALVPATITLTAGTSLPSGFSSSALPSNWIALDGGGKLNLVTEWQYKSAAVNVTAGNYYLVVAWRNDTSQGNQPPAAIDNVSITKLACSYEVTDLTVRNITTTSATLSWSAGDATQWQVAYSIANNFEGAIEEIVSAATYNMANLQPGTHYFAKVRSYCGGEDFGSWSDVLELNTDCNPLTEYPYTENFDGITVASASTPTARTLPVCWDAINTTTYNSYKVYPAIYNYSSYGNSTPNCLRFFSNYSSSFDYDPQPQYAILPTMENLAGKQITLQARGYNTSSTFKIGLMSDPNDANTFIEIPTQQGLTNSYQEFEYIIPADATATHVAIMIEAANSERTSNGVYIDDITIDEAPTCIKPTGLVKSDVTAHEATISWTSDATAWQVCLNNDEDHLINVTANTYTFENLAPKTDYTVKVRTNCGNDDYSEWSKGVSFTTTIACPVPTSFTTSNVGAHSVTLSWTSEASEWVVAYKISTEEEFTEVPVTENPYVLEGLDPETQYTVKVKDVCGGIDGESQYTTTRSFTTTAVCPAPGNLTVSNLTATGATLTWTELGEGAVWFICLDDDEEHLIEVDEPTYTFTELQSETVHTAKVKSDCSADGVWSSTVSFEPTVKLVIGSGTATSSYLPTNTNYDYSYSQQIYTVEELGDAGLIESIDFYMTSNSAYTRNLDIYMVSTDKESFTGANDWIAVTDADKVFSGEVVFTPQAWTTITLTNPFIYDGTQNVAIIVDDNTGVYSFRYFRAFTASASQSHYCYQDNTNIDPSNPSTSYNYTDTSKNQIRILKSALSGCMKPTGLTANNVGSRSVELNWTENGEATAWVISYNGTAVDVTTDPSYTLTGLAPETEYTVKVRPDCDENLWSSEITFTTEVACSAPTNVVASNITNNSAVISWESEADNFNVRYRRKEAEPTFFEDFEDGLTGWTTIDADGDGNNWKLGSVLQAGYTPYSYDGNDWVASQSYDGSALTPDNYLITPQVQLGGMIRFYASPQDDDVFAEHIGIAVSTTNNTSTDAFTTIWEYTMTENVYKEFTVDLSAYAGQTGYVAIRHFNCTGQFYLNVDDFGIYATGEWQTPDNSHVSESIITLTGLTPETDYEVQVQSDCGDEDGGSSWVSTLFTTLPNDAAPYDLSSTQTSTTATLSWVGAQDSYNVRYRKLVAGEEVETTEDFSGQIAVSYDATNGELPTGWYSYTTGTHAPRVSNHRNYSFISALTDNYLLMTTNDTGQSTYAIMPQYSDITEVSFNYTFERTSACGNLEVGYVTDNTGYSTFTRVGEPITPATGSHSYTLSSADIATINSNNGYIAFKYNSNSSSWFSAAIDDVVVTTQSFTPGAWNTDNTNVTSGLTINSLETNTTYEWQVQGIISSQLKDAVTTDWSDSNKFTTLSFIELVNDDSGNAAGSKNSDVINTYNGQTVDVKLTDHILYKDENWNTICLPFDVTIAGSPLDGEGVTAKTLVSATVTPSGDHISLNFGDTNLTALEAGVPYIIKWDKDVVNPEIQNPVFTGVTIKNSTEEERTVSPINEVKFIGYYDAKPITSADENIYYMTANNTLKHTGQDRTLKSLRAYFEFTVPSGSVREFTLNFGDGESSGIISIDSEQLESNWYTIDGKMLDKQPTRKGVYIKDGNKVVIK